MNEALSDQENASPTPRSLGTAAVLSWVWGIIMIIESFAFISPMLSQGQVMVMPFFLSITGIGACYAGYGLKRRLGFSRWLAIALSLINISVMLFMGVALSIVAVMLSIAAAVLVILNWTKFDSKT